MRFLLLSLVLFSGLQLKADPSQPTKTYKKKVSSLLPSHIKLAIDLVGKYSIEELEDEALNIRGCCLKLHNRKYFHAIKYYYRIENKYYRLKFSGISADDQPLTNGVYRREQKSHHENQDRTKEEERIWRAATLGVAFL